MTGARATRCAAVRTLPPTRPVPITYEVQSQDRIVVVTLAGDLALSDYRAAVREALADPRYEPGSAIVLDARALEALPSLDDIRGLVYVARELSARAVEPFAIVVATDVQLLAGRLFATFAGATINLETRVFRGMDAAMEWLRSALAARASRVEVLLGAGAALPT
jgi:hypothetical protein